MVTMRGKAKVKGCKSKGAHLIEHGFQIKSCRVSNAAQEGSQAMVHKHSIACKTCRQGNVSSGDCRAWHTVNIQETWRWLSSAFEEHRNLLAQAASFLFVTPTDKQQLQHFRCAGLCLPVSFVCVCQPQTAFRVNKANVSNAHSLQNRRCVQT